MSIIIRLQNLPWDANAITIRQFFHGFSIPSGGVHIVGGEKGDAFIAFTNDEDARLAMGKNGEMIGSSMVKLFLSSKNEMQNVINQARKSSEEAAHAHSNMPFSGFNQTGSSENDGASRNHLFNKPDVNNYMGQDSYNKHADGNFNTTNNVYDNRPDFQSQRNQQPPVNKLGYTTLDSNVNSYKNIDPFKGNASRNDFSQMGSRFTGPNIINNEMFHSNPLMRNKGPSNFASEMDTSSSRIRPQMGGGGFQNPPGGFQNRPWPSTFINNNNQNMTRQGGTESQPNLLDRSLFGSELNSRQPRFYEEGFNQFPNSCGANIDMPQTNLNRYPIDNKIPERLDQNRYPMDNKVPERLDQNRYPMDNKVPERLDQNRYPIDNRPQERIDQNRYSMDNRPQERVDLNRYSMDNRVQERVDLNRYNMDIKVPERVDPNWGYNSNNNNMIMNQPRKPFLMDQSQNLSHPPTNTMKPAESFGVKRPAPISDDYCVVIQNLPKTFNYKEIRTLFKGSDIDSDGIRIINDEFGWRTGQAYVRFQNGKSLELALRKDKSIIDSCKVNIQECSELEFTRAIDSYQPSIATRQKSDATTAFCVIIKKLPLNYTVSDVKKLLGNVRYTKNGGPHIEKTRAGKSMGNALAELDKRRDFDDVIALHRQKVRGEPIIVIPITRNEFESRVKVSESFSSPTATVKEDLPEREKGETRTCILMKGLPYEANIPTIKDFFRGIPIVEDGIHVVLDGNNRPSGSAYVEFITEGDCLRAKQKDKEFIGRRYVDITRCTRQDMLDNLSHAGKSSKSVGSIEKGVETYVYMRQLSEKTQLDDIMTFFRGYRPILDSIKLQYKDDKPTGDGLVAFASRKEAEEVVRNCYKKQLHGRSIDLELWER